MTETEWLESQDPRRMLEFVRDRVSERKMRLFCAACLRCTWPISDARLAEWRAEIYENDVDTFGTGYENASVWAKCRHDYETPEVMAKRTHFLRCIVGNPYRPVYRSDEPILPGDPLVMNEQGKFIKAPPDAKWRYHATTPMHSDGTVGVWNAIAHMGLGLEFNHTLLDVSCLSEDVLQIATTIYAENRWDELYALSDALEEAGCDNEQVLGHLQEEGHVRGCWVLDLILGKE